MRQMLGQTSQNPGSGLGSYRVGPPDGKWGQLSHSHCFRAGSLIPVLTMLALPWWGAGSALLSVAVDGGQGQLSHSYDRKDSSPT